MANNDANKSDLAYADTLEVDRYPGGPNRAKYKQVVLGPLFQKYISDAFEARRDELKRELETDGITDAQRESLLENRDEYTADRVFWVPLEARWQNLQNQATSRDIATQIDAVERDTQASRANLRAITPAAASR